MYKYTGARKLFDLDVAAPLDILDSTAQEVLQLAHSA
jgi:hypothetical protein